MRYLITRSTFGASGEAELTREEFDIIRAAKRGVFLALRIEERFAILRENYREYEREIFEIAQREVIYAQFEYSDYIDDVYAVNRRLLNLLAAARLCRDQLPNDLRRATFVPSAIRHEIRVIRDRETADSWVFDFMESMRDKIQHRILPVSHGGRKTSVDDRDDGDRMIRHTAEPQISLQYLLDAKEITRELLEKVKPHALKDDLIMLNPLVREYMQLMGKVHKAVQEKLADLVAGWDATYLGAIERGAAATGDTFALSLCCEYEETDDELLIEKPPKDEDLFEDLVKRRKYLAGRASRAHMMPDAKNYVSTE